MANRSAFLFSLSAVALVLLVAPARGQDKFRLKPGAKGKQCLACHSEFQEKLKNPFVHTPVREGNCSECHNPHASSHAKMLDRDVKKICFKCHGNVVPPNARSAHQVALEGNCAKCHDPHASRNRNNLLAAGNSVCFGCHKEMGEKVAKAKFPHSPVTKGCTGCHNPHASAKAGSLLKEGVSSLCLGCHKTDTPVFAKQHMNYPVGKADCTSCHDTHGSSTSAMLYDTVHRPVAVKMCGQCHEAAGTPNALKTKRAGYELCRGCHANLVNEALSRNRLHYPIVGGRACLTCHSPHASPEKNLMQGPLAKVCGNCHSDTVARQEKVKVKHKPVQGGNCTACHAPHASNQSLLNPKDNVVELCGTCHDWEKHVTHPIGAKVIDPRNRNLTVQCLSCHQSHGTEHKYMLFQATVSESCTQCHAELKR